MKLFSFPWNDLARSLKEKKIVAVRITSGNLNESRDAHPNPYIEITQVNASIIQCFKNSVIELKRKHLFHTLYFLEGP